MLWTDAIFISSADLSTIDAEVPAVADAEGITLDGTNGLIQRSIEGAGREIMRRMMGFAGFLTGDSLSANHLQAVFNIGTPAVQRSRLLLDNLVVSGPNANSWSDIKTWAVYKALVDFYRAASNRNTQDRYATKRDDFAKILQWEVWQQLKVSGLPAVYKNMSCPAPFFGHGDGILTISTVAGAGTVAGDYDVAATYIDQTQPANNESHPSLIQTVTLASGRVIKVDISDLTPPNGSGNIIDLSRCVITPLTATGWNIYAGPAGGRLWLQNATPIAIATKTFSLPGDPLVTGARVGLGQYPNQYLTIIDTVVKA